MTQLLPNIFAVEVPEDVDGFEISIQPDELPCVTYWSGENIEPSVISLPPGSYEILFTTKPNNEGEAEKVVSSFELAGEKGYRDYLWGRELRYPFKYASSSLMSLLRSHGLDENKNYLLLKKIS